MKKFLLGLLCVGCVSLNINAKNTSNPMKHGNHTKEQFIADIDKIEPDLLATAFGMDGSAKRKLIADIDKIEPDLGMVLGAGNMADMHVKAHGGTEGKEHTEIWFEDVAQELAAAQRLGAKTS